jgi:hypothetical protein
VVTGWLHAFACVFVPCLIGAVMYGGFGAWDRRRRRVRGDDGLPPIDYSI